MWISYDGPDSIAEKIKFAQGLGLNGVMIFTPQQDDYANNYPLCDKINQLVKGLPPGNGKIGSQLTSEALKAALAISENMVWGVLEEGLIGSDVLFINNILEKLGYAVDFIDWVTRNL